MTAEPRQAFLLVSVEGCSKEEAARMLEVDAPTLLKLVEEAGGEVAAQLATDVLISWFSATKPSSHYSRPLPSLCRIPWRPSFIRNGHDLTILILFEHLTIPIAVSPEQLIWRSACLLNPKPLDSNWNDINLSQNAIDLLFVARYLFLKRVQTNWMINFYRISYKINE
jgi:hypothetical protein